MSPAALRPPLHPWARTGVVAGVVALVLGLSGSGGVLVAPVVAAVALTLGVVVLSGVRTSAGTRRGTGWAVAALGLGLASAVLPVALFAFGTPVGAEFTSTCTQLVDGRSLPCE